MSQVTLLTKNVLMSWRHLSLSCGLIVWLVATAVTAHDTPQMADTPAYLPLIIRSPEPHIISFQVEPGAANPGESVTLSWEVQYADRVTLYRFWDYRPAEWWDYLPLVSTHNYTIPDSERNPVYFMLFAFNTVTGEEASAGVFVTVICPESWFFNPQPDGCPTSPIYSAAAEQPFEGGFMIWLGFQERIIVLFADSMLPKVSNHTDEWDGGEICDLGPPPEGRFHPVRGFGYLWCNNESVRARLGWALEPETAYETVIQWTTMVRYNHTYLRAVDGNVWHLLPESSGWEKIVVEP